MNPALDTPVVASDLFLRVGGSSGLQTSPPLGTHTWQHLGTHGSCEATVRIDCALCAGVDSSSRALVPTFNRVSCTSVGLSWSHPTPPYW